MIMMMFEKNGEERPRSPPAVPVVPGRIQPLNLKDHCLFCLQPQSIETLLEVAGRNPGLKKDLHSIINYLIGDVPTAFNANEEGWDGRMGIADIDSLPPVTCPSCYDMLEELHRLHRKLLEIQSLIREQTQLARNMIVSKIQGPSLSTASTRQLFYSKLQSSGDMSVEEARSAMDFVGTIHDQIVMKASVAVNRDEVKLPLLFGKASHYSMEVVLPDSPPTMMDTDTEVEDVTIKSERDEDEDQAVEEDKFEELTDIGRGGSDVDAADDNAWSPDSLVESGTSEYDNDSGSDEDYIPSTVTPKSKPKQSTTTAASSPQPSSSRRSPIKRKIEEQATFDHNKRSRSSTSTPKRKAKNCSTTKPKKKDPRIRKRPQLIRPLIFEGTTTSQYCDLCGELHPSSLIQSHLESQHGVQDFVAKCPNHSCPYVFSCRGKLDKHLAEDRRGRNNDCRRAAKLPKTRAFLKKCAVCGFETTAMHQFQDHLNKEHESGMQSKPLKCPLQSCPLTFALQQSVEWHLFKHDEEDERRYSLQTKLAIGLMPVSNVRCCDLCGKKVPIPEMEDHLKQSHNLQDYLTKCLNPKCPKVFSCRLKMEKHVLACLNCRSASNRSPNFPQKLKKCEICGLDVNRTRFVNHLEWHEFQITDKNLPCPIPGCPNKYALKQSMEDHLMTHDLRQTRPKFPKQECSLCKLSLKPEDMEGHLKELHQIEKVIPCARCPFRFHDWASLLDHLEVHRSRSIRGGGSLSCDICCADDDNNAGIKFLRYDSLRQHFFDVHQVGSPFICEDCGVEFYSRQRLATHKRSAHSSIKKGEELPSGREAVASKKKRKHNCDLCPNNISFGTDAGLYSHKVKVHGAPLPTCTLCNETFNSLDGLRRHKRVHLGLAVKAKEYRCSFEGCDRVFKYAAKWRDHELGAHKDPSEPKQFICEVCGKGFHVPSRLAAHVNSVHLKTRGIRPICEICGESFASSTALKKHKLIHTGERPFGCPVCQQRFRHKEALTTHVKAHEEKGASFKPNGPMKNIRKRRTEKK